MTDFIQLVREALAGRYLIERELGAGGMATVYLAEDLRHRRKVAVKVLRPELAATLGTERFLREIELAARLQHPHILPLHDSGESEGILYYVMPFVEGESLRDRLAHAGALSVDDGVRYLAEVTDALAYAHEQGVVHRDVKPDNVMISGRHALVMDFGIAKAVTEAAGAATLTTAGLAVGTPTYMAPEQVTADPHIDHRADIYALGVLGYELLSGAPPFHGGTPQQTLAAHISRVPAPLAEQRPSLPPALSAAIMRCLEKEPAERWQTAGNLLQVLDRVRTASGGTPATPAPPHRARTVWVVSILVVVGGVLAIRQLARRNPAVPVLGQSIQITSDPGLEIFPAISPDGKLLAYASGTAARMRIFIRPVSGDRRIPLSDDSLSFSSEPEWSRDGERVLFLSGGGVYASSALGGGATPVVPPREGSPVGSSTWSPDRRAVAFVRSDTLWVRKLDGSADRRLFSGGELSGCAWGPDGSAIVCVQGNPLFRQVGPLLGNLAPSRLLLVPLDGGTPIPLTDATSQNESPVWSGPARILFLSSRDGPRDVYGLFLGRGGRPTAPPVRITTGLNPQAISISGDGAKLAYSVYSERANIWTLPVPAGSPASVAGATAVTSGSQTVESMKVTGDGKWLLYDSNLHGSSDLFRVPLGGGPPERLTDDPGDEFVPDLSTGGRLLAYHSFYQGSRDLFIRDLREGTVTQLTHSPLQEGRPVWSPAGDAIAYTDLSLQEFSAWVIRRGPEGEWKAPQLAARGVGFCDWAPRGDRLYCIRAAGGIVSLPAVGGVPVDMYRVRPAHDDPAPLQLRLDLERTTIYFKSQSNRGQSEIWTLPVGGGTPRLLVRFDDATRPSDRIDFATDGRRLFFPIQDRQSDIWVANLLPR